MKDPSVLFMKSKRNIKFHFDLMHLDGNLNKALDEIPTAIGMNNHQGSKASADSNVVGSIAKVMKEQKITGSKSNLESERLAIKEGLKTVSFSGILGKNLCFAGNDAELPGYVIQIKDQKWTLMASHSPDPC